jgi:hypothetical protein
MTVRGPGGFLVITLTKFTMTAVFFGIVVLWRRTTAWAGKHHSMLRLKS